jgi:hypothetical protein
MSAGWRRWLALGGGTALRGRTAPGARLALASALVVVGAGACASGSSPSASGVPATPGSPSASATDVVPDGCPIPTQTGVLPSDRLLDATIADIGASDRVVFRFGSASGEIADARGTLRRVEPPFFEDGSGAEVTVEGERFIEIRFDGLLIAGEDGSPTYQGERDRRPGMTAVRELAVIGEFEGVMTWIVGIRGRGCVTLGGDPAAGLVVIDIAHG